MTDISEKIFNNEDAARRYIEQMRWPDGVCCVTCNKPGRVEKLPVKTMNAKGWYYCGRCRKRFTVRVGTIYERSHIPLHKWLLGTQLMLASKKGMSAHQLHRMLGITYKAAWFMGHRIRESLKDGGAGPMGGGGMPVEIDEAYLGKKRINLVTRTTTGKPLTAHGSKARSNKMAVVSLVSGGKARSFTVERADGATISKIVADNVAKDARLHTDESMIYRSAGKTVAKHESLKHYRGEYYFFLPLGLRFHPFSSATLSAVSF